MSFKLSDFKVGDRVQTRDGQQYTVLWIAGWGHPEWMTVKTPTGLWNWIRPEEVKKIIELADGERRIRRGV